MTRALFEKRPVAILGDIAHATPISNGNAEIPHTNLHKLARLGEVEPVDSVRRCVVVRVKVGIRRARFVNRDRGVALIIPRD